MKGTKECRRECVECTVITIIRKHCYFNEDVLDDPVHVQVCSMRVDNVNVFKVIKGT